MSIESPAVCPVEYLVSSYVWVEDNRFYNPPSHWALGFPEHFTELDLACARQKDLCDRAASARIRAREKGRNRLQLDPIVWRMQHIATPTECYDMPEYHNA